MILINQLLWSMWATDITGLSRYSCRVRFRTPDYFEEFLIFAEYMGMRWPGTIKVSVISDSLLYNPKRFIDIREGFLTYHHIGEWRCKHWTEFDHIDYTQFRKFSNAIKFYEKVVKIY